MITPVNGRVRDELKFVIPFQARTALLDRWRRHLTKDPHTNADAVSPVLSMYYDSPRLAFYEEKLDGIAFRNKVRIRTYGTCFQEGQPAFLEIKQRLYDRVRKIRQSLPQFRFSDFQPDNWTFDTIANEDAFRALQLRYRLRPAAQVWYQREAYQGTVEPDVRVTLDSCLTALHPGERLTHDMLFDPSRRCMGDTTFILEVKTTHGLPGWVTEGAKWAELTQVPVPKYVMAVEKLRLHELTPSGVYL